MRRVLSSPAIRSAVRLTLAMLTGNLLLLSVFGANPAATQGSFAIVILLLMLDYDGSARERLLSYLAATAIGTCFVVVGVAVATSWLAIALTLPIMFGFAFARVLKGFIARSAVGLPLAYFLPVMTGVPIASLGSMTLGWLMGCGIAIAFAMLVLPRHRSGQARKVLATWCASSADFIRALAANGPLDAAERRLAEAHRAVGEVTSGFDRPGALAPRLRSLLQMANVTTAAVYVAEAVHQADRPRHSEILADPSIRAFDCAEALVRLEPVEHTVDDLVALRAQDLDAARMWSIERLRSDGGAAAVAELRAHYPIRLASISATTTQWLAGRSAGRSLPEPDIGQMSTTTPGQLIRGNLTWGSPWFRNALRTAIAAAIAVAIAKVLGLEHGFWVVMATLSLIQTNFSSSSSNQRAWRDALGAVAGVCAGAALVFLDPRLWVFALVLAAAAFAAKALPATSPARTQFIFSLFVIANVTVLSWPPSMATAEYRLIDVLIGSLVAIALTLVIFPRGVHRLIDRSQREALDEAAHYVTICTRSLTEAGFNPEDTRPARDTCALAVTRFVDALDAEYIAQDSWDARYAALQRSEAIMRDSLLAGDAMVNLTRIGERPADVPALARALTEQPDAARIAAAADGDPEAVAAHPQALASTVWAGWWLEFLGASRRALSGGG